MVFRENTFQRTCIYDTPHQSYLQVSSECFIEALTTRLFFHYDDVHIFLFPSRPRSLATSGFISFYLYCTSFTLFLLHRLDDYVT